MARLTVLSSRRTLLGLLACSAALATLPAPAQTTPGTTAPARTLEVGAMVAARTLADQHDRPLHIDEGVRWVVFGADKKTTDWLSPALVARGAAVLARAGVVYVADISAMPALITSMFALPKLRELPLNVGLARDVALLADLPRRAGLATVIRLDRLQVRSLQHVADAAALDAALTP